MLRQLFNKSFLTLEQVMDELMIKHIYDKLTLKITDVNIENTMKVLLRCKLMFEARNKLINILKIIEKREKLLEELNYFVIQE